MSKKIINQADDVVSEMMEGFVAAYDRYYEKVGDVNGILYKNHRKNQVGLVIGAEAATIPCLPVLWAGDWLTRLPAAMCLLPRTREPSWRWARLSMEAGASFSSTAIMRETT